MPQRRPGSLLGEDKEGFLKNKTVFQLPGRRLTAAVQGRSGARTPHRDVRGRGPDLVPPRPVHTVHGAGRDPAD